MLIIDKEEVVVVPGVLVEGEGGGGRNEKQNNNKIVPCHVMSQLSTNIHVVTKPLEIFFNFIKII